MASETKALRAVEQSDDTETPEAFTLRPIVTKDLFTVIRIILPKLDIQRIREIYSDIRNQPPEQRESYFGMVGVEILTMVLEVVAEDAVQEWLADLIGKTKEQFLDMPLDTTFKVLQAMWADEDIRKIFMTLLQ
jgi:hypothetical protein